MYREDHKATLYRALRQLPQYEPPAGLWTAIAEGLEEDESEERLLGALRRLPGYAPPPEVWQAIEQGLGEEPRLPAPALPRRRRRRAWSIAAAVALLGTAALIWWQETRPPAAIVTIEQTQEIRPDDLAAAADWNADEAAFHQVLNQVSDHPLLRETPQLKTLQEELEELNGAKEEIEYMMQRYGRDAELVRQIGKIERERSELLKQLVAMI